MMQSLQVFLEGQKLDEMRPPQFFRQCGNLRCNSRRSGVSGGGFGLVRVIAPEDRFGFMGALRAEAPAAGAVAIPGCDIPAVVFFTTTRPRIPRHRQDGRGIHLT